MPIGIVIIVVASLIFTLFLIKMVMEQKRAERSPDISKGDFDALKERVRVLERITVEEGNSLAAEIAALENRSGSTRAEKLSESLSDLGDMSPSRSNA